MKGALVIFAAMVVIGIILYLIDVFYYRKKYPTQPPQPADSVKTDGSVHADSDPAGSVTSKNGATEKNGMSAGEDGGMCCGMHTVCEKTNLSPLTGEIVYYDDEELDRFRGREPESYTPEETEEFRDVLMTLLPEDVAGWSRSIQVREIALPPEVRDELLMIVSDLRHPSL